MNAKKGDNVSSNNNEWSIEFTQIDKGENVALFNTESDLNIKPLAIEVTNPINLNSFSNERYSVMYNSEGSVYQPDNDSLSIEMTIDEINSILTKLKLFHNFDGITNGMYNYKKFLSSKSDFDNIKDKCKFLSGGLLIKKGTFNYDNCFLGFAGFQKLIPIYNSQMHGGYKYTGTLMDSYGPGKVNLEMNPMSNYLIYYIILQTYSCLFKAEKRSFTGAEWWDEVNYVREDLNWFYSLLSSSGTCAPRMLKDSVVDQWSLSTIQGVLSDKITKADIVLNDLSYNVRFNNNQYTVINDVISNWKSVAGKTATVTNPYASSLVADKKVVICKTAIYEQGYIYYVDNDNVLHKVSITSYDYIPAASFNPKTTVMKSYNQIVDKVAVSLENNQICINVLNTAYTDGLLIDSYCPGKMTLSIEDNSNIAEFIVDSYYNEEYNQGTSELHNGMNCEVISKQLLMDVMNEWVLRRS